MPITVPCPHRRVCTLGLTLCVGLLTAVFSPPQLRAGEIKPTQTGEATGGQVKHYLLGLGNIIEQLRSGLRGTPRQENVAASMPLLGGAAGADDITGSGRLSALAIVDGAETERDTTDKGRGFNQHSYTATFGGDYRVTDTLFMGATVSYLTGETDVDGDVASQELDTYIIGFHGTQYWQNDLFLDWLVSYGSLELDLERFDGSSRFEADTDGDQWSADLSLGYQYSHRRWRLTPVLKAFHLRGEIDSYREARIAGANPAMNVDSQHFESTVVELSTQIEYVLLADWGVVIPSLRLAFQHDFADADKSSGQEITSGVTPGGSFAESPDDPDDSVLGARLGVSAQFQRGWSAFAGFERLFSHDFLDRHNITAGVRYEIP